MTTTGNISQDSGMVLGASFETENNSGIETIQSVIADGGPTDASSNGAEEWQIIYPEDHLRESSSETEIVGKAGEGLKYNEVDPSVMDQTGHSKFMVFICTALYSLLPIAALSSTLTLTYLLFTRYYFITILYLTLIFLHRNNCSSGGCRWDIVYRSKFWSYLASYFPVKLRYTSKLHFNPNDNYLLIYHPHGISAFGSVTAFATNGLKFSELFPGMTCRFMVHQTSFKVPVMREVFSLRGDCSVDARSIDYMLTRPQRGNVLALVSGGLAEADLSDMHDLKLVLKNRKGFVKKAIQHGAHLVPCIAFGENSVFTKVNHKPGSLMGIIESKWYKLFKFKHPAYYGTSILTDKIKGCMPYKRPITVVIGNPIRVDKVDSPSQELINEMHSIYVKQVHDMYAANKDLTTKFDKTLVLV